MLEVIKLLITCGTLLGLAFCILLSLPKSKLRAVLIQIVGWAVVLFSGAYVISPVDVIPEAILGPFGILDDLGILAVGFGAGSAALQAGREMKEL